MTLISVPALAGPDAYGMSGSLLALGALASLASGNVILKKIGDRHGLLTMSAWQLVLGGLPLLALSLLAERDAAVAWTATFAALLLGLALAGTALPYVAWNHLARQDEIGRLTLFLFLVPVLGVALAMLLFGERFGLTELAGLAAATAAVGVALAAAPARPSVAA